MIKVTFLLGSANIFIEILKKQFKYLAADSAGLSQKCNNAQT